MLNYREIIRLKSLGYSNLRVGNSCGSSRNTIAEVWKLAQTKGLSWPVQKEFTNEELAATLYPGRLTAQGRKIPDYEYIYKELAKSGVTLSLLWAEYCEQCQHENLIPFGNTALDFRKLCTKSPERYAQKVRKDCTF